MKVSKETCKTNSGAEDYDEIIAVLHADIVHEVAIRSAGRDVDKVLFHMDCMYPGHPNNSCIGRAIRLPPSCLFCLARSR